MREEELEKRLQSAFPNIPPPDEALHTRIQGLCGVKAARKRSRIIWMPILGGAVLAGVGGGVLSRQPIGDVLQKMSLATAPRTTYIEVQDFNSHGMEFRRLYWIAGDKQRVTIYAPRQLYGRDFIIHRVKQGNRIVSWFFDKSYGNINPTMATTAPVLVPPAPEGSASLSKTNWKQLTWRSPWIVRLPDRITQGRRQWILQQDQIHESSDLMTRGVANRSRMVWAVDTETKRVSWRENWLSSRGAPWLRTQRTEYRYNQPIPASLFKIPTNMALTPVLPPRTTMPEPAFQPHFPKTALPAASLIIDWWRATLSR